VRDEPLGFGFDAHAAVLRASGAEIILTSRSQSAWHIHRYRLTNVTVEFCSEGGASIVVGTLATDTISVAVTTKAHVKGIVLNGERIYPLNLVMIPSAHKYIKTSFGPHEWILASISLAGTSGANEFADLHKLSLKQQLLVVRSPTLGQTIFNIALALECEMKKGGLGSNEPRLRELERSLIDTILAATQVALSRIEASPEPQRPRSLRLSALALGAVELIIRAHLRNFSIREFCSELGTTERELRRSFRLLFHMGPTRLTRLHRANRVHRMLVGGVKPDTKMLDLLSAAEITEPGRFAGMYKALFGESPSVTRKRHLAHDSLYT
jgi:AraC-like DNA-binding protein